MRRQYQNQTKYFLLEARRALSFAQKDYILRNRPGYMEWMTSALDLLLEAYAARQIALAFPWQK
jgi:hypothetical protein